MNAKLLSERILILYLPLQVCDVVRIGTTWTLLFAER